MAQQTQEIDIRLWCVRILKHWYWFFISCFLFGCWGIYKYFATTPQYEVDSRIMIRSNESDNTLPQMDMMQMMGLNTGKMVEDEMAILTSRDVTGMGPAWILLSLSIWGSLLGIIGMIIALPLTTLLVSYYKRFVLHISDDMTNPLPRSSWNIPFLKRKRKK